MPLKRTPDLLFGRPPLLRAIRTLLDRWETETELGEVRGALFLTATVAYMRPFIGSNTTGYVGEKSTYPIRHLAAHEGFDRSLHKELEIIRHKFLAHADGEVYPPTLHTSGGSVTSGAGDQTLVPPFMATLSSFSLHSISERTLIERFRTHLEACLTISGQQLQHGLQDYLQQAAMNPTNHRLSREPKTTSGVEQEWIPFAATEMKPSHVALLANLEELQQKLISLPSAALPRTYFVYRMTSYSIFLPSIELKLGTTDLTIRFSTDPETFSPPEEGS